MRRLLFAAAWSAVVCVCPPRLAAQTLTTFPYPLARTTVAARFLHILPNKGDAPFSDGALDLSVNVPVGNRINVLAALPIINDSQLGGASTSVGNLFLGAQIGADSTRRTVATLGMYIPIGAATASAIPLYVNRYEIQRYAGNYLTAYLNVAGQLAGQKDYALRGEVGTTFYAATKRADTSALAIHYGLAASAGSDDVKFVVEITGLINFSDSFLGVSDRFLNFVGLGASYCEGTVHPGLMIVLPMNQSLRSLVDGAVGVQLEVVL